MVPQILTNFEERWHSHFYTVAHFRLSMIKKGLFTLWTKQKARFTLNEKAKAER